MRKETRVDALSHFQPHTFSSSHLNTYICMLFYFHFYQLRHRALVLPLLFPFILTFVSLCFDPACFGLDFSVVLRPFSQFSYFHDAFNNSRGTPLSFCFDSWWPHSEGQDSINIRSLLVIFLVFIFCLSSLFCVIVLFTCCFFVPLFYIFDLSICFYVLLLIFFFFRMSPPATVTVELSTQPSTTPAATVALVITAATMLTGRWLMSLTDCEVTWVDDWQISTVAHL